MYAGLLSGIELGLNFKKGGKGKSKIKIESYISHPGCSMCSGLCEIFHPLFQLFSD
jgi:hypothetical protein